MLLYELNVVSVAQYARYLCVACVTLCFSPLVMYFVRCPVFIVACAARYAQNLSLVLCARYLCVVLCAARYAQYLCVALCAHCCMCYSVCSIFCIVLSLLYVAHVHSVLLTTHCVLLVFATYVAQCSL